jgi:chemotaxis methyl-accepting protein methylase/signal transduction histidine kinase
MVPHGSDTQTSGPGQDVPAGARPAIVGIGAAAGGLEALEALTRRLPAGGLAFVVMERVARRRPALAEFLARHAALPVVPAADGMPAEADHIYVAPPGVELTVRHGVLRLGAALPGQDDPRPIDALLRTLAADLGNRAIGVILSGAGDDGTLGLQAIREADGIAFIQDPSTARQPGMPRSARDAGVADFVLDAEHIADELAWLCRHPYIVARRQQRLDDDTRGRLFLLLRRRFGVDFGGYRPAAIDRRIHRRMVLHKLTRAEDYLRQVQASTTELGALYGDLLFSVTGFFHDPAQFDALTSVVFPQLLAQRSAEAPLRIWVPGCATGEEVYSIAICLLEHLGDRAADHEIQIFATDIDAGAIGRARHATYPLSIERQVSPQRLQRFFLPSDKGYQLQRAVRDLVVLAHHNLGEDPPLSRIDLVSCRNVLGALQPARQSKVLRDLHFALCPDGFLLLGADESMGEPCELFSPVDPQIQLYAKRISATVAERAEREYAQQDAVAHNRELEAENQALREAQSQLEESRGRYVDLYDFAPIAYCTFDRDGVVLELNLTGATLLGEDRSRILGRPLRALVRLDDPGALIAHIRAALATPLPTTGEIGFSTARGPCIARLISISARDRRGPATTCRTAMLDVTRQRLAEREAGAVHASQQELRLRIERLEQASAQVTAALATPAASDLRLLLQLIVDQARGVVDAEFVGLGIGGSQQRRFDPWVVSGVPAEQVATLGHAPRAVGLLGAVAYAGRPIRLRDVGEHASFSGLPLHHPALTSFLGVPIRYLGERRASLYLANKRGGAEFTEDDQMVIEMFADRVGVALEIARLRQIEVREHTRLALLAGAGPLLAEPIEYETTLDAVVRLVVPVMADLCAVDLVEDDGSMTKAAAHHPDPEVQQQLDRWLGTTGRDELPADLRAAIETAQPQLRDGAAEPLPGDAPEADYRRLLDAVGVTCAIVAPLVVRGRVAGVLRLAMAGSGRRYVPQDLELARELAHHAALAIERARLYREAQVAIGARDDLFAFVTHDLHNYLATIRVSAATLTAHGPEQRLNGHKQIELISRTVAHMARLIEGLRDATMIEAGQFTVATASEDVAALVGDAVETLAPQAEAKALQLTTQLDGELPAVVCDRDRVLQVIANLVSNAIKFTPRRGDIRIAVARMDGAVRVSVSDTGSGIPAALLARVFDRYWTGRDGGHGTGLGLFIAKGIVEAHGGRIWVESTPGAGSAFHFTLPLAPAAPRSASRDAPAARPPS